MGDAASEDESKAAKFKRLIEGFILAYYNVIKTLRPTKYLKISTTDSRQATAA